MTPQQGCGNGCLPRPGSYPTVSTVLRVARLLALVIVLMGGGIVAVAHRPAWTRAWFRLVLRAAGVRMTTPALPDTGTLVVANHVSWLDVPVVLALLPSRVVAKTDVRDWPVIGRLAELGGSIFIDRHRVKRLPATVAQVAAALRAGDNVFAFPEGTTWCGRTRGRYYPALFQAAVDADAPCRSISISYRLPDGRVTTSAAFIGDDTMLSSVWRVVGVRGLRADVRVDAPLAPAGATRRTLAAAAHAIHAAHPHAHAHPHIHAHPVAARA